MYNERDVSIQGHCVSGTIGFRDQGSQKICILFSSNFNDAFFVHLLLIYTFDHFILLLPPHCNKSKYHLPHLNTTMEAGPIPKHIGNTSVALHIFTFHGIHYVLTSVELHLLKMTSTWNIELPIQILHSIKMRHIRQSGRTLWSPIGQQLGPYWFVQKWGHFCNITFPFNPSIRRIL